MFTGIIQELGRVLSTTKTGGGVQFTIQAPASCKELSVDDSVAVSGVCLTVVGRNEASFKAEAVEETLLKTTLGSLAGGSKVNLELPVRPTDRLGGHLVQGHVDGIGSVSSIVNRESSRLVGVSIPREFRKYVIPVGSIAIDGVSLTIASVEGDRIIVSLIPHTLEKTTLADLREGTQVNLEFDVIGKYIERLVLEGSSPSSRLSKEKLRSWGYDV